MSVLDELGISEKESSLLSDDLMAEMIRKGAKLTAEKQMMGNDFLDRDDEEIRERANAVHASLLGMDANACTDKPYESQPTDEMKIRSLGDVYIGDQAIAAINRQSADKTIEQPPQQPAPQPQPSPLRWLMPLLIGAGIGFFGLLLGRYLIENPPAISPDSPKAVYDIEALEFKPIPANQG